MTTKNLTLMLLPLLLLACKTTPPPPVVEAVPSVPALVLPAPPPVQIAPPDETAQLLAYHANLRRKPAGELLKELSGLNLKLPTPHVSLQTGMVLTLTRGNGDLARAQALFDAVAGSAEPAAQSLAPLAALLASQCADLRKLAEQSERLASQLKENQRKTEQLNDMLEGLKAIERNLPARPGGQSALHQGGK